VLANSADHWLNAISPEQLKRLFDPKLQPNTLVWSQLRDTWPAIPIETFGTANDLITDVIPGQRASDGGPSLQAQSQLLLRLQRTVGGLTHVPFTDYLEFEPTLQPALKVVKVINDDGIAVVPTRSSIADGSYPLARPLLLFIKRRTRSAYVVEAFVKQALVTAERRLLRSSYLPLAAGETSLAIALTSRRGTAPFDLQGINPLSAREIILRQFPENEREARRSILLAN
jgi:phosphate transport system substrate-binding protein